MLKIPKSSKNRWFQWQYLEIMKYLEQNGGFDHIPEGSASSLQNMTNILQGLKISSLSLQAFVINIQLLSTIFRFLFYLYSASVHRIQPLSSISTLCHQYPHFLINIQTLSSIFSLCLQHSTLFVMSLFNFMMIIRGSL